MRKIARLSILVLATLLTLAILPACGSNEATPAPGGNVPGISLSITSSTCPGLEINLNDQVTWTNADSVEHPLRVNYPDGETLVDLGVLQPGDSASVTFPQAGSYSYICSQEPATPGTITVLP